MLIATPVIVIALGDSTTAGTPGFQSPLEAPPSGAGNTESQYAYWLMKTHAEWDVRNRGINGERSDQIRARFDRDVLAAKPSVVVIIAGVNDIYQGRSAASVQSQLEAMYDAARAARIVVVAGTIIPYNTATPDQNARMHVVNQWVRDYVRNRTPRRPSDGGPTSSGTPGVQAQPQHEGIVFCDTRAAVAAPGQPDLLASSPDGLHPSPGGYRLMALALEPAIKTALTGR